MGLDLEGDLVALLRSITDIESVSGNEARLADEVEAALMAYPHLEVTRHQDAVVARTSLGRDTRVVIAGHLDTVPVASNLPSSLRVVDGQERVYGRGTCDMKGGVAVQLRAAAAL
ncbi:MAG: M20/M25/M40 family metallo-hydrolase, partial [Propionibacteriaceae bacterium]|nr:M20/M25/M40 family metallo-hydrolase [Propionibacteriaceae bacterium]